jgi:hypothetical protein
MTDDKEAIAQLVEVVQRTAAGLPSHRRGEADDACEVKVKVDHDFLVKLLTPRRSAKDSLGVDTVEGAIFAAALFRRVLRAWHGEHAAHLILASSPPDPATLNRWKNESILSRCDSMGPKLNVRQLARKLAAENAGLPKAEQWGPRGTTNPLTMDAHIRRLRKQRAKRKE